MKAAHVWGAISALVLSQSAFPLDFHGYVRANGGANSQSGAQTCFGLAGAGSKYRLGNECGVYGQVFFGQEIARSSDGAALTGNVMFILDNGTESDPRLAKGASNTSVGQAYFATNKLPVLGSGSAWIGRRFYKREDVHITDFFYWNPSGIGAGVEDVAVGDTGMKFSYAWLHDDTNAATARLSNRDAATRHDFQLRGINVNAGGQLELGLSLVGKDAAQDNRSGGVMATVQHRQSGLFGGENKFALQFGNGAAATSEGGRGTDTRNAGSAHRFRLVESLYFQPTPKFGGQWVTVYQRDAAGDGAPSSAWTSWGGRLAYGVTPQFKLLADLGKDRVAPSIGSVRYLTKYSVAAAWSAGPGYYDRPEVRLFYTRAQWNDAARNAAAPGDAISATGTFGNVSAGSVIGVSAETWW